MMWSSIGMTLRGIALGGLALAFTAPAVSAEIYAWQTEDGVYAYSDDPEGVPERYRDQIQVRDRSALSDYGRFTRQDSSASGQYAQRLAKRLEHLRRVNGSTIQHAAPAPSGPVTSATTVTVATGNAQAPTIDVNTENGDGPLVVEPVLTKRQGEVRTRTATLVKQGGRTIAVLKPRPVEHNPSSDIYDEDELGR